MLACCWLALFTLVSTPGHWLTLCDTGPGGVALSAHELLKIASVVAGDDKRKSKAEVTWPFQRQAADHEIRLHPQIVGHL